MTPAQQRSKLGSTGTETIIETLTIRHPEISTLYLVAGKQPHTFNGQDYVPFAFAVVPPAKGGTETVKMQITVNIVDQRVEAALLALRGQTDVYMTYQAYYLSDSATAWGPLTMEYDGLVMQSMTQAVITCTFMKDVLTRQYPCLNVAPSNAL